MGYPTKNEMMKTCFLILLVVVSAATGGRAQLLGGFFDQGATELKDYAAQIAALQLYIHKAQQGYRILESGLAGIGNIHQAEYDLHQAYFGGLAAVNPKITAMPEIAEIVKLQPAVGAAGQADIVELTDVLTPGKLTMSDDQRFQRILELDADMKRRYGAVQELSVQTQLLIWQRQAAAVGSIQQLYGLH
jgi:hypothetical protein